MKKSFFFLFAILFSINAFAIDPPPLYLPANNSTGWYTDRSIRCYIIDGITDFTNYTFELDTTPLFNSPLYIEATGTDYNTSPSHIRMENLDLLYGVNYFWRVKVTDGVETSVWSDTWNFSTLEKINLYLPANNAVNQYTDRSVRCYDEDFNIEFDNYEFEMDTSANFNSPLNSISPGTSSSSGYIYKTNTDLLYGQKYYWRARVRNANDTSAWSDTWNFTTLEKLNLYLPSNNAVNQITNLSIRCYDEDFNTDFDSYEFEIDTTVNFNSPLLELTHGTGTSSGYIYKANTDLLYGQKYYWRARVRNANDTSAWSDTWNFTTLEKPNLYLPSNNAVSQITNLLIRCYDEDSNTDFDNYDFEIDTSANFNSALYETSHGTSSSSGYIYKSNADLRYGQTYYWRARVRNANDTSAWSDTRNFTTLEKPKLYLPSDNAVNQITNLLIRCYDEDSNTDFDNYDFEIDTSANFNSALYETSHGTSSSSGYIYKSNADLRYGQTYYWRARVRNANDTSAWSDTRNFTTLEKLNLYLPSNNAVNQITNLLIRCYDEDSNTDFDNYDFEIDTSANFNSALYETSHGTSSSSGYIYKSNADLRYGQTYYWRARVRNSNDTSDWSAVWNFKTDYELTSGPDLISPSDDSNGISYTSFVIDWNTVSGANSYQYQVSTNSDFTIIIKSGNTSLTERTITNIDPNTLYYWRVRAENLNGYSPWSVVWSFTTETTVLTVPVLISPANNDTGISFNSVEFSWNSVFGASEYTFEISQDNTFTTGVTSMNTSEGTINLTNLEESAEYFWRVNATDGITISDWSQVWSFTTDSDISINDPEQNRLFIYPNIVIDHCKIRSEETIQIIRIFDIKGRQITEQMFNSNFIRIDTNNYNDGLYLIYIKTDTRSYFRKIIIKR